MKRLLRTVDLISEYSGRLSKWFGLALVFALTYETVARYVFNAPTVWAYVVSMMLYGTIGMMGLAYTDHHDGHIRVDVIYVRLSTRGKAIIDACLTLLLVFPLLYVLLRTGAHWMVQAIVNHETMMESFWYPPSWPFRTMVVLALGLFTIQYIARFIRDVYKIAKGKPYA
jgi:TRAP-type mannitol/chloroaromatic compound transport system permease small subunit